MLIRDRLILGALAGLLGNTAKTLVDEISLKAKVSQRSFRSTAAGVWVSDKKQASSAKGQLLGGLLDYTMSMGGGILLTEVLSRTGRDHYIAKGIGFGVGFGSMVSAVLSGLPTNKVRPKDAASNLSYMVSHVAYGLLATLTVAKLGHPSLFDIRPPNYLPPTDKTSEQMRRARMSGRVPLSPAEGPHPQGHR